MGLDVRDLVRRARAHYNCGVPHIDTHNRKAWIRSVLWLGKKWKLHPVNNQKRITQ
jgi:hypothetical protein